MFLVDFSILYAFHYPKNHEKAIRSLYRGHPYTPFAGCTDSSISGGTRSKPEGCKVFRLGFFPVARDLDEALDDLREYSKDRSDVKMKKDGENLVIAEKVSIPTFVTKRGDLIGYGYINEN